ncbi:hypothetical protein EVAR_14454_1 [Eumeta japonica]|uniref:Uncharacterized protein n=1 Tax=Eumeta variegata TaxID=151549 RepID=A0A4C1U378_EUMVA|nr:hypothetical protein EVAR_14454_1 [Eumeta japonica]
MFDLTKGRPCQPIDTFETLFRKEIAKNDKKHRVPASGATIKFEVVKRLKVPMMFIEDVSEFVQRSTYKVQFKEVLAEGHTYQPSAIFRNVNHGGGGDLCRPYPSKVCFLIAAIGLDSLPVVAFVENRTSLHALGLTYVHITYTDVIDQPTRIDMR